MPWYRAWIIPVKAWMFSHILTQFARNKPQKHIQQLSMCVDGQAQRKWTYQHAACIVRIHIRAPTVGGFSRILEISVAQRRDVRPGAGAQARIRAACGGTARNLRRRHACLGRTRRSVAKIAAARRLKARKSASFNRNVDQTEADPNQAEVWRVALPSLLPLPPHSGCVYRKPEWVPLTFQW